MKPNSLLKKYFPGIALWNAKARHDLDVVNSYQGRGYAGGNQSRMRKSMAGSRSLDMDEDSLTSGSALTMMLESMDLYRNNPLCKSGVNGIVDYLGHTVPLANSETYADEKNKAEAKEFDAEATDYFMSYFWNRADHRRRPGVHFGLLQDFVTRAAWTHGDMLFIWKGDGFIPVEAFRIATPAIKDTQGIMRGIKRNAKGQITHYYVCARGQGGSVDTRNFTRVPAWSCIYTPWYWRPDQLRGVPRLHGVIDSLRDHEEIHEYTKAKIKHEAMLLTKERAGVTKTQIGRNLISNSDGTKTEVNPVDWGMQFKIHGDPDDWEMLAGDTPNAQYVETMQYDGKMIAAGMNIPYEILMHIYTAGSYTAHRAARVDFINILEKERNWRNDVFNQRVWNLVIADAMNKGRIRPAPLDKRGFSTWHRVLWSTVHMKEIDQGKEVVANQKQWRLGKVSMDDVARETGRTADELLDAKQKDIIKAITRASAIEKETGAIVDWRDIIDAGQNVPQVNIKEIGNE